MEVRGSGTYGVVIAIDKAHTFRTVIANRGATNTLDIDVDLDVEGGEVIKIEDQQRPKPTVAAKPKQDVQLSLPYSEESIERDAWARAWLLLDVDQYGHVSRLKLLKRPGFGLEKICLEEAFKMRFAPARDHAGRPMKTYVLWTMEWPSWGWLIQGNGTAMRRPKDSDQLHVFTPNVQHGVTHREYVPPEDKGSLVGAETTGADRCFSLGTATALALDSGVRASAPDRSTWISRTVPIATARSQTWPRLNRYPGSRARPLPRRSPRCRRPICGWWKPGPKGRACPGTSRSEPPVPACSRPRSRSCDTTSTSSVPLTTAGRARRISGSSSAMPSTATSGGLV